MIITTISIKKNNNNDDDDSDNDRKIYAIKFGDWFLNIFTGNVIFPALVKGR